MEWYEYDVFDDISVMYRYFILVLKEKWIWMN